MKVALLPAILLTCLAWGAAAQAPGSSTFPVDEIPGELPHVPDPRPNLPSPATEEPAKPTETVVAGLSRDSVAITASFDGSEILIYGAIKRESPIPEGAPLDIIVTIEAPSQQLTIRRKERVAGIWINTDKVEIGAAPGFYAVASTRPLEQALDPDWDNRYRISLPLALRSYAARSEVSNPVPFTEALIRLRRENGLYRLDEAGVKLVDQTLFRADFRLPANLIEGDYKTRIFLLREGRVIDVYRAPIEVRKVGVERWLYRLAFDQPFLYGLMSLAVAVIAGWGASALFRKLRKA